jgi:predicted SnoaL-like aldol condensation-catalyzing enzyme
MKPLVSIFALVFSTAAFADDATNDAVKHKEAVKQATAAAESWLARVDDGKYGESWDAAAAYLKNTVSKDAFAQSLAAARKPLGAMKSRKVRTADYRTSLPGAPDGQYVVIQFQTSFENKKAAVEAVTPMLEKDGTWRVSGYYIK